MEVSQNLLQIKRIIILSKVGFCFPAKIFYAVDFPIPIVPTNPKTSLTWGTGDLWSLKALAQYHCVVSSSKLLGKLTIDKVPKGHININTTTHQRVSEIYSILFSSIISIHNFCIWTMGHFFVFLWTFLRFPFVILDNSYSCSFVCQNWRKWSPYSGKHRGDLPSGLSDINITYTDI